MFVSLGSESYAQRIKSYFMKKSFEIQAFMVWLFVGVPGIFVTLHYLQGV